MLNDIVYENVGTLLFCKHIFYLVGGSLHALGMSMIWIPHFGKNLKIGKLFGHQHSYLWGLSKFMIWAMPGVL